MATDLARNSGGNCQRTGPLDAPHEPKPGGAATSTVEALMFGLREGIDALPANPEKLRRLSELSEEQLRAVCQRTQSFRPYIAPMWSPQEVQALIDIWCVANGKIIT